MFSEIGTPEPHSHKTVLSQRKSTSPKFPTIGPSSQASNKDEIFLPFDMWKLILYLSWTPLCQVYALTKQTVFPLVLQQTHDHLKMGA